MRFPIVLFDLDGTLIDSGSMILASFRHATRTVLAREIPDEVLLAHVGGATLDEQMRALDATRVEELVASYRDHNGPLHDELRPCAGVVDVLERLHAEGRRLGVVTAKRQATVSLAFRVLPLGHLFDAVVASDDVARNKPHPDGILRALGLLHARPEDAAYVGDSPFDVEAAKRADVYAVAVGWGGIHPRERLEACAPDVFVESAEELLGVL
jgi:pyrophosphatase PpaX